MIEFIRVKLFRLQRKLEMWRGVHNVIRAKYWGIKIGSHAKFNGHCYFFKAQGSSISIGSNFMCKSKVNLPTLIKRPSVMQTTQAGAEIVIGNNVGISGCALHCFKRIIIEDDVKIGGNCTLMDGDFHPEDPRSGVPREIIIGKNVWVGCNTTILKGVHIGENTVIGACSVVVKDIPANCVAVGNPCKVVKYIN